MTLQQFALSIINDPLYRATVTARAHAGTLPPDVESLLWDLSELELADGGGSLLTVDCASTPAQSRTLALIRRPSAHDDDEITDETEAL